MIKIKGHSEFKINIYKDMICKSSDNINFKRLQKQINKQEEFYNKYTNLICAKTPKIILLYNNQCLMEYIYFSENIIDFISQGNIRKIDWFFDKIINIIENYIKLCRYKKIDKKILLDKIIDVDNNLKNNINIDYNHIYIKNSLKYLYENYNEISENEIPVGLCHGDLSFSNILIDQSRMEIYLIDFLDSFIDSPLLDIVKIRQDTKFYWILKMYDDKIDKNSILIALDYFDIKFNNYFNKYKYYNKNYEFYEVLNNLRVLQYSKINNIYLFNK